MISQSRQLQYIRLTPESAVKSAQLLGLTLAPWSAVSDAISGCLSPTSSTTSGHCDALRAQIPVPVYSQLVSVPMRPCQVAVLWVINSPADIRAMPDYQCQLIPLYLTKNQVCGNWLRTADLSTSARELYSRRVYTGNLG